jgi:arylsulfatase A-like enzyme
VNTTKRTRREFLQAMGLYASAFVIPGCAGSARRAAIELSENRPNILWITCEDVSPDYLCCYGDDFATTPNLDKLASEGVRYTKTFATAPVCAPARSCLITGVYATSLGTQHLRSDIKLPIQIKCFPQYLRATGYYCSNNYKKDYNFMDVGVWDESSKTAHWRKRKPGQPFFSVFNFTSTHQGQINGSDQEFFAKYRSKLKPEERHDPAKIKLPPYYPDTPFVRNIWARYYDLIAFMDKQVGDLLSQLEADGLADNTIVFFFSDHGMGIPRFKRTLYDSGLHVPLMIRFPKKYKHLAPIKAGRTTDRLVSFVDFAPTVYNLVGFHMRHYMQGWAFLGPQAGPPRKYVYGAASRVDEVYEMSRCVRDKRYKYIRNYMPHLPHIQPSEYPDRAEIMQELRRVAAEGKLTGPQKSWWEPGRPIEELYDTQADPHEINNLADSSKHKAIQKCLHKVLRDWMVETRDTGLLSEAEMHIRSAGSTPYEMAHDPDKYPLERILDAAELVGRGPEKLAELIELLADSDGAVRYWAVVGLTALGMRAKPASGALAKLLTDERPNVRFAAAGVLCKLGSCDKALEVLARGLEDSRETVALYAAREIQGIVNKACPIVPQIKQAQARCKNSDGSYKNNNHAMFIDWALKYALQNCSQ